MASNHQSFSRLRKELARLNKEPVPWIEAVPLESNILEWHYCITGPTDSVYKGGYYHGKIKFPIEYPYKPPSVMMITPSGRFRPNSRLCLSMSDFHPETWNPLWSVSSILSGLLSFMLENTPTVGSIDTTDEQKRELAPLSLEYNIKDPIFLKLFPHYADIFQKQVAERIKQEALNPNLISGSSESSTANLLPNNISNNKLIKFWDLLIIFSIIISILFAIGYLYI